MIDDGIQQTLLVKEYRFLREELSILDPLNRRQKDIEKGKNEFVANKVFPRFGLGANQKYQVIFDEE